ncbi:hypothetical protein Bbelb_145400 [Branchiostoma belcheri]|nr:hypothetical protein Bbelb_145400 [Branchiostoma belcheri]
MVCSLKAWLVRREYLGAGDRDSVDRCFEHGGQPGHFAAKAQGLPAQSFRIEPDRFASIRLGTGSNPDESESIRLDPDNSIRKGLSTAVTENGELTTATGCECREMYTTRRVCLTAVCPNVTVGGIDFLSPASPSLVEATVFPQKGLVEDIRGLRVNRNGHRMVITSGKLFISQSPAQRTGLLPVLPAAAALARRHQTSMTPPSPQTGSDGETVSFYVPVSDSSLPFNIDPKPSRQKATLSR